MLRDANLRTAVSERAFDVLNNFAGTANTQPFLGAFAKGGVALVGEDGPELAHLPSGTRVHNAQDTQRMLRQHVGFIVNGDIVNVPKGRDPVEVVFNDPRFNRAVKRARVGGRILPGHGA